MSTKAAETTPPVPVSTPQHVKVKSDLLTFKARPAAFKLNPAFPKVEILDATGEGTETHAARGTRVNGGENAPECLVQIDGTRQIGVALVVVSYAILYGLLTDEELQSLLDARAAIKAAQ